MRTDQPSDLLRPTDFGSASDLIKSLIATRSNRSERLEQNDVREATEAVGRYVENSPSPALRLEATALLGKVSESFNSKNLMTEVTAVIRRGLATPLPTIGSWGNADDRKYLAKAVAISNARWVPHFAAEALAQSDINEKVSRDIWAELAISRADDLATALAAISSAAAKWLSNREDTTELAYRKLRRICEALAQSMLTADVPTGREFGNAFASLVRVAGGGRGSDTLRLREEAAASVLDLIIEILRLRFDVLFDSDIYRAVGTVRGWWQPARPPEEIERRSDRIALLAMRGLQILARQGVQDKELRRALTKSLDSARVNLVGQAIADEDISLDPQSSTFLATGKEISAARSNEAVQQLNENATDELLGRLLLTTINRDVGPDTMASVADAIDLFEPAHAAVIRKASGRLELIGQWVDALAAKRRLATYSTRGELVQYDPAMHDSNERLQRLSEVRVSIPGVVRVAEGRPPAIITKAIVEKR